MEIREKYLPFMYLSIIDMYIKTWNKIPIIFLYS